ncbi:MAG TPA: periplasmic heavy metal sensor [Acetobacteraceae bacterium]|nr:periplasmic heavy metal sensor [Acetobacteraceae bacterium]
MDEKRPGIPVWWRIALPASLVLNLFFMGLIGGHMLRSNINSASGGPLLARALANAEASLSAPDAAAFASVIHRDAARYAKSARELFEARSTLQRQVTAEHYNQKATMLALEAWQASWNRFVDDFGKTLVEALGQVSPEGRRRLVAERRQAEIRLRVP